MALTRIWTPTGNYSSGGKKRILVIHTMEGFTGPNGAYDCAHYFQSSSAGASSQVCIDNNRGKVWEGVTRANGAWTQCGYNSVAISCEQSGYASWSRDYWLTNRSNKLHNIADWLAEESWQAAYEVRELPGTPMPLDDRNRPAPKSQVRHSLRFGSWGPTPGCVFFAPVSA